MTLTDIQRSVRLNELDYGHYTLARFIEEAFPGVSDYELWISFLTSIEMGKGNVCLDLKDIKRLANELGWQHPLSLEVLLRALPESKVIGLPLDNKPLVLDQQKIYLNRQYHYEKLIAQSLLSKRIGNRSSNSEIWDHINALFGTEEPEDYQKLAAIVSLLQRLCIISGGTGTGKTYTVSKILALLLKQKPDLKIKLATPTGKAAARLSESIKLLIPKLTLDIKVTDQLPTEAVTLHRLLGIHRYTHRPRYHLKRPLNCDVLVLDEASMIDQQMMAMICAALSPESKLILLGDKDQLSSVEAGSVFADLCGGLARTEFNQDQQQYCLQHGNYAVRRHESHFRLADNIVFLQKSHRFDQFSRIGQLAEAVKKGDSVKCLKILRSPTSNDEVNWYQPVAKDLPELLRQHAGPAAIQIAQSRSVTEAFHCFQQLQVLSAVWQGPFGVDVINQTLEAWVKQDQDLELTADFYQGKPLMMTTNAYQFGIHNGDIGIVWPDSNQELKVWFQVTKDEFRPLSLTQCPQHKSAYAMTVHKSQGSEFNRVILVLPELESTLISRELVYTGITRAALQVEIWAQQKVIEQSIQQVTQRTSGLMQRLSERD